MRSNLTNRLLEICGNADQTYGCTDNKSITRLTEEQRIQIEAELIQHFEFSKIVWMIQPTGLTEDGTQTLVAQTRKITDSQDGKHTGEVGYIYTITLTPKLYDPEERYTPVKDGCVFPPVVFDPETFEPKQSITLTWSPEFPRDLNAPELTIEEDKQRIKELLQKVLDNPEDYRPVGYIGGVLRYATVKAPLSN
jgi:hypothetical protein